MADSEIQESRFDIPGEPDSTKLLGHEALGKIKLGVHLDGLEQRTQSDSYFTSRVVPCSEFMKSKGVSTTSCPHVVVVFWRGE